MLTIDCANCLSDRIGEAHGLHPMSIEDGSPSARLGADLAATLSSRRGTGWERWRLLPFDPLRSEHVSAVRDVASRYEGKIDNLVVMGIGGSALGNIALQSALNSHTWNLLPDETRRGPRVFVIDNVDPAYFGSVLEFVRTSDPGLTRTLFNVVSKSGETAETASQFMTIRAMLIDVLGVQEHARQIVAITDPKKGTMRQICDEAGYATLPVPEGVGGRFSVLSPVGLFSAHIAGIDIDGLLDGAAAMEKRCSAPDLLANPALMLATLLLRLAREKSKTVHVMIPYANQLYLMADWFRQLWAESLGKKDDLDGNEVFAGFTPVKALGTTDQHSQVQLYREGPNDKAFVFLEVEDFGAADFDIPRGLGVEALEYLEGQSFSKLLNSEKRATEFALLESERPNFTIRFPRVDAEHVGEFIMLWEMVTAYAGAMLNIDPYNQPAVETGKVATFGLMGRAGYEEWKERVEERLGGASIGAACSQRS